MKAYTFFIHHKNMKDKIEALDHAIENTHLLNKRGFLDSSIRTILLMNLSSIIVTLGIIIYDIIFQHLGDGANGWAVAFLAGVGIPIGLWLASVYKIQWNQTKRQIFISHYNPWTGVIVLIIYFAFRLSSRFLMDEIYHDAVIAGGMSLASLWGIVVGRTTGIVMRLSKYNTHPFGEINN
jgi:hypothetical protein